MNYQKKTILDAELSGKRVLMRCDFNVPTDDAGNITDDSRIVKTLPTIKALLSRAQRSSSVPTRAVPKTAMRRSIPSRWWHSA